MIYPIKFSICSSSLERISKLKKISELNLPSNIQVHIRVRPLISNELLLSSKRFLGITNNRQLLCGNDREFNFDFIYDENSTQDLIFNNSIKSNLDKCLEGYNFSALAYGQTVK